MGMEHSKFQPQFPLETLKARECRRRLAETRERWRQKEEDERGVVAAERKRALQRADRERKACEAKERKAEEARSQREMALYQEAKEKHERLESEEMEKRRLEFEELQRLRRQAAEQDRQRRMPWTCGHCNGSGRCPLCDGAGHLDSLFLSSYVVPEKSLEFGRKPQGCPDCSGYGPGIRGELQSGSGHCNACDGRGKIWPELPAEASPKAAWPRGA